MLQPPSPQPHWISQRRHELDWLRVLAFTLLIAYHLGMAYVTDWGWHIKSAYQSETLQYLMRWSNQWRMSLLFMISGAALSYQLHRYSGWLLPTHLFRRLLLPLAFGSLVIVAPQSFVESQMANAIPDMSYLEFWGHYVGYPWGAGELLPPVYRRFSGANVIWNHLWYLPYLLAYCLVLWVMYPLLSRPSVVLAARILERCLPLAALYLLPVLLIFAIGQWLGARFPTTHLFIDDWHNHARSFTVFVLGFCLVRSQRFWLGLAHLRQVSLLLAISSYAMASFYVEGGQVAEYAPLLSSIEAPLQGFVWSANLWLWLMAILGYAQVWLNRPSALIQSANRAVYCWYILHQTLIVIGVYVLRTYEVGPVWEPLLVTLWVVGACLMGYQLVKNLPVIRELMGVFPAKTASMESCPRRSPCSHQ